MTQANKLQNEIDKLLSEKGLLEKFIHVSHEMILRGNLYRRIGNPDFIDLGVFPNHYYRNSDLIRIWDNRLREVIKELNKLSEKFDQIEALKDQLCELTSKKIGLVKTKDKLNTFKERLVSLELYYSDEDLEYSSTKELDKLVELPHESHPIPVYISAIDEKLSLIEMLISQMEEGINDLSADLFCVGELSDDIDKEDKELIEFQKRESIWPDVVNDFHEKQRIREIPLIIQLIRETDGFKHW